MSNGWQLEFSIWGDDSLRLAFWDSAGNVGDHIYRLNDDGSVDLMTFDNDDPDDLTEQTTPVILAEELRNLLDQLDHTEGA
jgi:hypothetical protein